jgi:phytoene dehydrogenase-like protein
MHLTTGVEILARRGVLTACSPKTTLTRLLPKGVLPPKLQVAADNIPTLKRGITDYKLNVALKGKIRMTRHEKWRGDGLDLRVACNSFHTYEQTLAAMRDCVRGDVPQHVPGLGMVSTAFDESMAPAGCDLYWFWTGLTPSIPRLPWSEAKKQITENVIRDASLYYEGVDELEVARRDLALPDIEDRFWAIDGNVYHVDPIISRFAGRKPAAGFAGYRTPVPGLFLTGSGTHPVAGISGMPGQNAARAMLRFFRSEDKGRKPFRLAADRDRERVIAERLAAVEHAGTDA